MLILSFIFIIIFLLNYFTYWVIWIKITEQRSSSLSFYKKIFPIISIICINTIPIINSSFLEPFFNENVSYFWHYWIWFFLLGVIFLTVGFRIYSLEKRIQKLEQGEEKEHKLFTIGVYKIVRHPNCMAWLLIFIGTTFIFDSIISLILIPILVILTQLNGFLREKYILYPKFGEIYEIYKQKTPYRIISPPYNYLLVIIAIFVVYIGFINFEYIF